MAEWTAAQVKELKRAWKARDVVSVIAERLGMTRNAVMCKVHRLHLDARPSPIIRSKWRPKQKLKSKRKRSTHQAPAFVHHKKLDALPLTRAQELVLIEQAVAAGKVVRVEQADVVHYNVLMEETRKDFYRLNNRTLVRDARTKFWDGLRGKQQ